MPTTMHHQPKVPRPSKQASFLGPVISTYNTEPSAAMNSSGPIHTGRGTRCAHKLERFSFDVACVHCGHPHSHQQVPFARVTLMPDQTD